MTQSSFIQIPFELIQYVRNLKLSGTQYELWLYLYCYDPYGDRFVEIPSPETIALELGVNARTIQRAAQRLKDAGLFDFEIKAWKCKNTTESTSDKKIRIRTKRSTSGQKDPHLDKKIHIRTKRSTSGQKDPNPNSEPLPDKGSEPLQTIQNIQTSQTGGGSEILIEETSNGDCTKLKTVEVERTVMEAEEEERPLTQLGDVLKRKLPPRVDEKVNKTNKLTNTEIPQDLINKLEELEIPLDEKVRKAIASHHLSQAYGAAAHVARTWETIDNPRGVFLYQISRQPIEKLGPTGRVYTASDFGDITLDQLKHLYPKTWQDAAKHYGIEIPEGEEIEAKDPEQDKKRKQEIIEKYKLIFPNDWQRLAKSMGVEYE